MISRLKNQAIRVGSGWVVTYWTWWSQGPRFRSSQTADIIQPPPSGWWLPIYCPNQQPTLNFSSLGQQKQHSSRQGSAADTHQLSCYIDPKKYKWVPGESSGHSWELTTLVLDKGSKLMCTWSPQIHPNHQFLDLL